jgi:hypothetical protein
LSGGDLLVSASELGRLQSPNVTFESVSGLIDVLSVDLSDSSQLRFSLCC